MGSNDSLQFSFCDNVASEHKLLNPLRFILNENEAPSSASKSDQADLKKSAEDLKEAVYDVMLDDPLYGTTSKMLSENEMLITLPYNDSGKPAQEEHLSFIQNISYENNIGSKANTFEIDYNQHAYDENAENSNSNNENIEVIMENFQTETPDKITNNTSVKILRILSSNNSDKQSPAVSELAENSVIIEEICANDTKSHESVKTLTLIGNVRLNNINDSQEVEVSRSNLAGDSVEIHSHKVTEKETMPRYIDNGKMELGNISNKGRPKNSYPWKSIKTKAGKTAIKRRKNIVIDLEKLTTPSNVNLRHNSVLQTYTRRKKKDESNMNNKSHEVMYQKIPLPNKEEQVEKERSEISVYDFYDEEEERLKIEKREREEAMQPIKERTCLYCKEIFNDPMDVLRHKREQHTPRKIRLTQEELQPYLQLKNRTHCPLCSKGICPNGYKSLYVKHLMTHCENSNFSCKVCGIKFRRKDHMQTHEKRHVVSPESVN